jgi:hypothetical protein
MVKKIDYTKKLQKMVKKRKIPIITHKQGRRKSITRRSLTSLSYESYSFEDYNN